MWGQRLRLVHDEKVLSTRSAIRREGSVMIRESKLFVAASLVGTLCVVGAAVLIVFGLQ